MTALFINLGSLKYDDRKGISLQDYIQQFEVHWLKFAPAAAIGATGSLAAEVRFFTLSDG